MASSGSNVVVSAFTEEQVERLTGLSKGRLRYWDRTEFFQPSLASDNRRDSYSRIYSFRDLICLQVLNALRNEANVSLPHLRSVKERLAHLGDDMWAKTTLYVLNKRVIIHNEETDSKEEVVSGQGVLQIPLAVVRGDMEKAVRNLWKRDRSTVGKIEQHRGVVHNHPVIAGTRIPVRAIKAFHAEGYSVAQIRKEYPALTEADIRAALEYGEAA